MSCLAIPAARKKVENAESSGEQDLSGIILEHDFVLPLFVEDNERVIVVKKEVLQLSLLSLDQGLLNNVE